MAEILTEKLATKPPKSWRDTYREAGRTLRLMPGA